jgi:hypothetical protein
MLQGGRWKRSQNGSAGLDHSGDQLAAASVIIQFVAYRDTGLHDTAGSPVPEAQLVGQGEAWLFTDGIVAKGRWSKPSPGVPTAYRDPAGAPVKLTPGADLGGTGPDGGSRPNRLTPGAAATVAVVGRHKPR